MIDILDVIKEFEGCKLKAYKDSGGVWTIGYGFTEGVVEGDEITQVEADRRLRYEINKRIDFLNRQKLRLTPNKFWALVSFVYNVGEKNFLDSTLLKKIKEDSNDKSIRDEFMRWVYAGGKKLKGLEKRRKKEADIYFEPI